MFRNYYFSIFLKNVKYAAVFLSALKSCDEMKNLFNPFRSHLQSYCPSISHYVPKKKKEINFFVFLCQN